LFFVDNLSFLWLIYFSRLDNEIGDAGVSDIAEALKVNSTLNEISFYCVNGFFVLVSSFFSEILFFSEKQTGNYIGVDGTAQIAEALKVNVALTMLFFGSK